MQHVRVVALDPSDSFDGSLWAAQAQVPDAAAAFVAAHGGWVAGTVSALCRRLGVPEQDHKDTLQETYRRLLDPRLERFAPSRGGGRNYVRGVVLNAIDFGGRRRRRAQEGARPATEADDWSMDVVDPDWREAFDQADARLNLSRLLRRADPVVARALALVCADGLSQREAARLVGVSEFKLSRALSRLSALARLAA